MMLIDYLRRLYLEMIKTNPEKYVSHLRKKGATIGTNVHMYDSNIDMRYLKLFSVGDNVSFSGVTVLMHDAVLKKINGKSKVGRVTIGNNVFVGYGSIILPGITIEDNVIIGAGSIIRKDIPSGSVVTGNPAQIVCSVDEFVKKLELKSEGISTFDLSKAGEMDRLSREIDKIAYIL